MFAKAKAPAVRWRNGAFRGAAMAGAEAAQAAGFDIYTPDTTARLVLADYLAERGYTAAEACERDTARVLSSRVGFAGLWRHARRTLPSGHPTRDVIQTNIEWARPDGPGWWTDCAIMFRLRPRDRSQVAGMEHTPTDGRVFPVGIAEDVLGRERARDATPIDPHRPVKAEWTDGRDVLWVWMLTEDTVTPRVAVDRRYWSFLRGYYPLAEWRFSGPGNALSLWEGGEVAAVLMPLIV